LKLTLFEVGETSHGQRRGCDDAEAVAADEPSRWLIAPREKDAHARKETGGNGSVERFPVYAMR
jgi:hypothetical protein